MKQQLRVNQLATIVGLSRQQIWSIAESIPGMTMVGRERRFNATDPELKRWIRERKRLVETRQRTPRWLSNIWKSISQVNRLDAEYLGKNAEAIMEEISLFVRVVYARYDGINPQLGKLFKSKMERHMAYIDERRRQDRLAITLGTDTGSGAKMNRRNLR